MRDGIAYRSKHELAFVYRWGRPLTSIWLHNVWELDPGQSAGGLALHLTVKPTGLAADAVQDVKRWPPSCNVFDAMHDEPRDLPLRFEYRGISTGPSDVAAGIF